MIPAKIIQAGKQETLILVELACMVCVCIKQDLNLFVKLIKVWTEATAHRVTVNFDEGKVVKRKQVPIFQNDTAETLQARVLPVEYEVQIETLRDFANGTVSEFNRETPLVLSDEESILEECKQLAIKIYPKG